MADFNNILVHVDSREEGQNLVACALELAGNRPAKIKLVDILPQTSWPALFATGSHDRFLEQLANSKQDRLHQLAADIARDDVEISCRVLEAPSSLALIREAVQGKHDLLIKSAKGRQSRRAGFFGTTSQRLLRKCPLPVLLVKPEFTGPFLHVLASVDATSDHEEDMRLNEVIIRHAQQLCVGQAELNVLHAWSLYGESILKEHMRPEELEEALQQTESHADRCLDDLLVKFDLGVGQQSVHLVRGDPIDVIPQFIADHQTDLLVMGTVGRSGLAGVLMGNSAEQILERVSCSVLAVKPPGFKTPIRLDD